MKVLQEDTGTLRGAIGPLGCLLLVASIVVLLISQCVPAHAATCTRSGPVKGIDLYVQGNDGSDFQQQVAYGIRNATSVGANSITIVFPIWMANPTASAILTQSPTTDRRTPTSAELSLIITQARTACLGTTLRPTLDESTLKPGWRGSVAPANVGQWFDSYKSYLATLPHADALSIGTELESLEGQMYHWYDLIDWLRPQIGTEQLTYGQNHSDLWMRPEWFSKLDYLGIDFYFANYQLTGSPSEADFEAAISAHDPAWLSAQTGFPADRISLAEVGLSSYAGSYREPWDIKPGPVSYPERDAYLSAVCKVFTGRVHSIYFWNFALYTDTVPGSFGLNGTPNQQTVRTCFTQ